MLYDVDDGIGTRVTEGQNDQGAIHGAVEIGRSQETQVESQICRLVWGPADDEGDINDEEKLDDSSLGA